MTDKGQLAVTSRRGAQTFGLGAHTHLVHSALLSCNRVAHAQSLCVKTGCMQVVRGAAHSRRILSCVGIAVAVVAATDRGVDVL